MHALIIESDAMIAMSIEDALRDIGYASFDFAVTAPEAIAASERRCPDLVTSSLRLIEGSGVEAVRNICSDRHVPVVFVTTTGWVVRRQLEAAEVVQKPFAPAELHRAVGRSRRNLAYPVPNRAAQS